MLSVIICSKEERRFLNVSRVYQRLLAGIDYEIVCIENAKSLTSGYNEGVRRAKNDLLVFSHDDIVILDRNFKDKLIKRLGQYDIIGIAGTKKLCDAKWTIAGPSYLFGQVIHLLRNEEKTSYQVEVYNNCRRVFDGIQAMDGLFLATHRRVVEQIPFDEKNFDGFHMYDIDFTYRAYRAGLKLAVCSDIPILHFSRGNFSGAWKTYSERFNEMHRASLALDHGVKSNVAIYEVSKTSEACVFMENPLWEPWP